MTASLLHVQQSNDGIELLTASNYTTWNHDMETILRDSNLWHLIESPNENSNKKSNAWRRQNKWAKELIRDHVDESFMSCFLSLTREKSAKQMWEALANHDFQQDDSSEYNETGPEALQRATTTEEKSKALDQMRAEYNAAPEDYMKTVTPDVLENLTDILDEPGYNSENSLKLKVLEFLKSLVNHVTKDNIKMFLNIASKILVIVDFVVPQSPQSKLCIAVVVALSHSIDAIFAWLDEMDVKSTLTFYFTLVSNMSHSALINAGHKGLATFFKAQQMAIFVFRLLQPEMQRKLINISLNIIEKASDTTREIVTYCLALLKKLKDMFVVVGVLLLERTSDCLRALFRMMTSGFTFARECVKNALEMMRSFGSETVGKYVDENRDYIDVDELEKSYTYWQSFREYLGDLLNWFQMNVLLKLNKFFSAAANFVEEHPILSAGLALGVLFGALAIGSRSSRNQ